MVSAAMKLKDTYSLAESALQYQMAGNTTEYDGSLGKAPEGAYTCFQVGPMYLTEEGWRCDGTGTGI